ncbi:MAG: UDP-N-acetylmuramate dehydrogenase [Fervidobacterium sp.]
MPNELSSDIKSSLNNFHRTLFEHLWDIGCDIFVNETLSSHVSFRLGGKTPLFVVPSSLNGLVEAIKVLKDQEIPFRILGKGTNIIPRDGLIPFVVLSTERVDDYKIDGEKIIIGAGTSFKKLNLIALENELSGLERSYGLPGSVGGAVYMNAGCYNWETAEVVSEVLAFDGKDIIRLSKSDLNFSYRSSIFKEHKELTILQATFQLKSGKREFIKSEMLETMRKRYEKQPLEYPSAGSVFKRPRQDFYVGTAIESLGLKGFKIGGAQVSEKHAGFIVNTGNAKAEDVFNLIQFIREKVKEKYNVILEIEVEIW